jgi:hypothetical protein
MAVVAAENPLSGEAGIIRERHHCGKVGLLYILVHKPTMNKLVSTKLIVGALVQPASFANGKDRAPARIQLSTQDDPHRLREQPHGCLLRDSSKTLQNVIKLRRKN